MAKSLAWYIPQEKSDPVPDHAYDSLTDEPNAATRVFNITELLELILQDCDIPELMNLAQVSRAVNVVVESSKQQMILPLKPSHKLGEIRFPFYTCLMHRPGYFTCYGIRDIFATFCLRQRASLNPRVGDKYRGMFISQPPPTSMSVQVTPWGRYLDIFTGNWTYGPLPAAELTVGTVSAWDGIRIGDLFDSAVKAVEEYEETKGENYIINTFRGWPGRGYQFHFTSKLRTRFTANLRNRGREVPPHKMSWRRSPAS